MRSIQKGLLISVLCFFSISAFAQTKADQKIAVETAMWGIPIVSMDAMRQAFFRDAKAQYNDIVYWSQPADWKNQTTTPNSSSFYIYMNFNTKSSPLVLEMPPTYKVGIFGVILDAWQKPMTEVGEEGADKGKGGKYLILPPGYQGEVPKGYQTFRSDTFNGYVLFRFTPITNKEADVNRARDLIKKLKAYDFVAAKNPPRQKYIDMAGNLFDGLIKFDASFYNVLAKMINEEPVVKHDEDRMADLQKIGLAKGREFKPTDDQTKMFNRAIKEAHTYFKDRMTNGIESFASGSRWGLNREAMVGKKSLFTFDTADGLDFKSRGFTFYLAYATPQHLGAASFYLATIRDSQGKTFQGEQSYKLRIPAKVPAKLYWAVNVYELETAAFIRNSPIVGLDSFSKTLVTNDDGTVDIYFGPKPPVGREANWIYTEAGKPWFAFFRLYGPGPEVMNKTWVLPDVERTPAIRQAGF